MVGLLELLLFSHRACPDLILPLLREEDERVTETTNHPIGTGGDACQMVLIN